MWDFFEDDMDFASYTEDYKMIAETLAYLILPTRRSYSPGELVDLIESMTGIPAQNACGIWSFLMSYYISRITNSMAESCNSCFITMPALR